MRMNQRLPTIGKLEFAVLEHLWATGAADVGEAYYAVGKQRGITQNTVGSALERLFRKGLVKRQKVSHAFRYRTALSRDEFTALRVLEAAGGGLARAGLLAAFVDLVFDVDERSLDRLEALIAEKREEQGSR